MADEGSVDAHSLDFSEPEFALCTDYTDYSGPKSASVVLRLCSSCFAGGGDYDLQYKSPSTTGWLGPPLTEMTSRYVLDDFG